MPVRALFLAAWLGWSAWQTQRYVEVWRDDLTLWAYAVQRAPLKPRPWVNYGVTLCGRGLVSACRDAFTLAERLAAQPHVPAWDRLDTASAVAANLARMGTR